MSVMDVVPIVELVVKVAAALRERRETYLENTEINDAIEQRREALLRRLTISHNRILFEISDSDLVIRLVPFAMEQTLSLYSASKEADFSLIELSISQIESALITNEASRRSRQSRRTLAVWFAAIVIVILIGIVAASPYLGLSTDTIIPVIRIPLPIIIWSGIGSLGAMLYRFNNSVDAELADPLRWSFTRPLTGVLMGIIAYLAFKIGLLVLQPMSAPDGATVTRLSAPQELLWLAAFLAGFSDRFADSVLRSLAGRLGGDRQAELHTAEQTMSSTGSVMRDLADRLGWGKPLTSATAIEQSRAVLPTVEPPEPPPRTGALAQTRRSRKRAGAQTGETTPQISLGEPNTVVAFPESVPKEGI